MITDKGTGWAVDWSLFFKVSVKVITMSSTAGIPLSIVATYVALVEPLLYAEVIVMEECKPNPAPVTFGLEANFTLLPGLETQNDSILVIHLLSLTVCWIFLIKNSTLDG